MREKGKTSAFQHDVKHRKDINSFNNAQRRRDFKQKTREIPSQAPSKSQIPSRPTKTALRVKQNWTRQSNELDSRVQSICSAKHKKRRTPSLDPKKGVAAFRRCALVPEKGVGIADVVPQAGQKRVEDKGGHDGKCENHGAP